MNNEVTIVIPISRFDYLDKLFTSLEFLECDRRFTNLLTLVDGDSNLYVNVRNRTDKTKFANRLCVQFTSSQSLKQYDILRRRTRISEIHNKAKSLIGTSKYVLGIEDDTIVPSNALVQLVRDYAMYPYAGFIQGAELGRWGIPYVGAWTLDDVYSPTKIESLLVGDGIQEIDAGGFYCFLTQTQTYKLHEFKSFDGNLLGPDVDFGVELRRQGVINYVDWSIKCTHKSLDKDIKFSNTDAKIVSFIKRDGGWRQSNKEYVL